MPDPHLAAFLAEAVGISLSGVMAPGPVTAVTLGMGPGNRHAGILVALGHGIVELPLMLLIMAGVGQVFKEPWVRVAIGLAGGAMMLLMGAGMLADARKAGDVAPKAARRGPLLTGIVLSAGNPYFLLWWATIGLALATRATELGIVAFGLFAVLHWLCDAVWLEVLSWTSHRGSRLFGRRSRAAVLVICGAALLAFGVSFLYRSGRDLKRLSARTPRIEAPGPPSPGPPRDTQSRPRSASPRRGRSSPTAGRPRCPSPRSPGSHAPPGSRTPA
jgi:threonine/homoserine/homoserine lactone efflux protein